MSILPPDYKSRVYAGWLGKTIGVRFGAPLENWTYQQICEHLGEVNDYLPLPPGKIFKPDDDTAMPLIFLHGLEDFGPEISEADMGETWLNYLGDQHSTLWWGGYGISSEHTAYLNLKAGIPAPHSGAMAFNGPVLSQQIGGQIFSDIWGLVIPTDPARAAAYAAMAARVSHDSAGVHGARFIAALVSTAFHESDPERLIKSGLSVIPAESEYARMVDAVLNFYRQRPDDWHAAYHFIAEHYGGYPGLVHIIPNAAIVVMALLYGAGDFSRSISIANMAGWDTDCNVGNVGAIMGVAVGLSGIEKRWWEPINDVLVAASNIGINNLTDLAAVTRLIVRLGYRLAGQTPPAPPQHYTFRFSGSTQGFQARARRGTIVSLAQTEAQEYGTLRVVIRKLKKKGDAHLFVETYLRPDRLSSNYYGASFSPKIWPGQTLRARLFLPPDNPDTIRAGLFVWDDNHGREYAAPGDLLQPGHWHEINFTIPSLHNALLSQVGLVVNNLGDELWSGSILLDWLDWEGAPKFSTDFSAERPEYGAISQWTYLRGYWRLEEDGYHGSGAEISESYTGDVTWQDYTLSVRLTPLLGDHHLILARVQGARRSYALGLCPEGLTLYKNHRGYQPQASASFAWTPNETYELHLKVAGEQVEGWVTDGPRLTWQDPDTPFRHGQIGLANFPACHTRYEWLMVEGRENR